MLLTILVAVLVGLISAVYLWARYRSNYWQRTAVPFIPAQPFVGNLGPVIGMQCNLFELFDRWYYDERVRDAPIFGVHFCNEPVLVLRDADLIRQLLVADFGAFSDRFQHSDVHDPLGNQNVLMIRNPLWRKLRQRLSTFFTSNRLRRMFHLVEAVGVDLDAHLLKGTMKTGTKRTPNESVELEAKELASLFTTDVIASCMFGIQANSFGDQESEFRKFGRTAFDFKLFRAIETFAVFFVPHVTRIFRFRMFNEAMTKFLRSSISFVVGERERSGAVRHDFIDTLIELKRADHDRVLEKDNIRFDGDILVAQAGIFFTAGFEPSSGIIAYALYELACNPDMQARLRAEIRTMLEQNGDQFEYESVQNLHYLQMFVSEVLRLYPLLPMLDRRCTLKRGQKSYSLRPHGIDFEIPNGMGIIIPISAIQHDERFYPEPQRFDPERFAPENRENLVPYTFLAFGEGPRNCIGERFGWLQTKIGIVHVLRNHVVRPTERTQVPLRFNKKSVFSQAEKGIHLNFVRDPLIVKK